LLAQIDAALLETGNISETARDLGLTPATRKTLAGAMSRLVLSSRR